ncbi:MAG: hypothetical protein KA401_01475, partial [Anaerolineae bacterium]|nr:hypothetical protein [Anaerolineae bacterium]
ADLVGVHRGVARAVVALRKGYDLEESGDFFPVELFERLAACGARLDPVRTSSAFLTAGCLHYCVV